MSIWLFLLFSYYEKAAANILLKISLWAYICVSLSYGEVESLRHRVGIFNFIGKYETILCDCNADTLSGPI